MMESRTESSWDFDSGKLPLDFANTIEWRLSAEPVEWLNGYQDLVSWSMDAGLIDEEGALSLMEQAAQRPEEAQAAFERSLALREAIFGIFSAVTQLERIRDSDLALLNDVLQEASQSLRVKSISEGFEWVWSRDSLDWMLGPIARSAAELVTSTELERVGICADDRGCVYVFYDTSRNHSRRWCSMESCGNRAKARRHYQRKSDPIRAQGA